MTGDTVYFPQVIVCIAGRESKVRLINAKKTRIEIKELPECVEALHLFEDDGDLVLTLLGKSYQPNREYITFLVGEGENSHEEKIPVKVFTSHEFFVVFCLEANFHHGWDPSILQQYYPELASENNVSCEGEGIFGSGYQFLYDDSLARACGKEFIPLEKIYHENNIPITWLIDEHVADKLAPRIIDWAQRFGDTYSILPTSRSYTNPVNYNVEKTLRETRDLVEKTWRSVLRLFEENGFPRYAEVCGVDQWIGSIGTNFVKAALDLGFKGLWGMAWDVQMADTSMHHRGAPWNAYKPSRFQFRIPAREGEKHELFLFQWTIRDLVNSLHLSPRGSMIFSSDPDDLRLNGILEQTNPHYLMAMLLEYLKNMKYNDYFVFTIHQEDHDAHFKENNEFLEKFVRKLVNETPPGISLATLEEVAQWMAIKFGDDETTSQILELEDPLVPRMRNKIKRERLAAIKQVYDPEMKGELQRIMVEHFPTTRTLPTHVAFFNRDIMFIGYKPYHLPVQLWDYTRKELWYVPELGEYPLSPLPKIDSVEESPANGYVVSFVSDRFFPNLPWITWNPPFRLKPGVPKDIAVQTDNVIVFFLNVQAGQNAFDLGPYISMK